MSHDERAAWMRLLAASHRKRAAEFDLAAACAVTASAFEGFSRAWQAGIDRDLAEHPDLAELNVQMDGFYGDSK